MPGQHRSTVSLVAIGGGSGLAVLLRGLKKRLDLVEGRDQLAAVVTVADDGGSSGRLRRELGVLPPGDIRNCIVALADDEDLLARLFQYRFAEGEGLTGHSFGNLFLSALTGVTGDFYQAILTAESILSVRGSILPATLTDVRLRGVGNSGTVYQGESAIGASGEPLRSLEMEPRNAEAFPQAVEAIQEADLILLGPGSLYTSILPNLLIPGIREAVRQRRGKTVLVLNLMTQPGETDHMSGFDHYRAIAELGDDLIDYVVANAIPPTQERLDLYAQEGAQSAVVDPEAFASHPTKIITADLLDEGPLIRHDPYKLAEAVLRLARNGL